MHKVLASAILSAATFNAVSAIPLTPAMWLFLSGLVGLGVLARRKVAPRRYR